VKLLLTANEVAEAIGVSTPQAVYAKVRQNLLPAPVRGRWHYQKLVDFLNKLHGYTPAGIKQISAQKNNAESILEQWLMENGTST
jgi:hypothetical protein